MKTNHFRQTMLLLALIYVVSLFWSINIFARDIIRNIPHQRITSSMNLAMNVQAGLSSNVESPLSYQYGKIVMYDIGHVFGSPIRWRGGDWLSFGSQAAAIALTYATLDKAIGDRIQDNRGHGLDNVAKAVRPIGAGGSVVVLGGFYAGGLVFKDARAKAVALDGVSATMVASFMITPALKELFGRGRPSDGKGNRYFKPFGNTTSFPSGHATRAFALASVIASHYDKTWVGAIAYAATGMVAWSRLNDNVHYTSDVLAGAAIGIAVGRTIVHFNKKLRAKNSPIALELF